MLYALIPFLPLFAFLIVGIGEQWIKDRAHLVAVPAMVGSFLLSLLALHDVATGQAINVPLYTWLTSGNLDIHIGISIDRLTAVMLILVTTVSTLVPAVSMRAMLAYSVVVLPDPVGPVTSTMP